MKIDKIYSRNRIRLSNCKRKKVNKLKLFTFFMIVLFIISIIVFINSSYPIFKASCETASSSIANSIVSSTIEEVMENYKYEYFMTIEKDNEGNIILIQSNTININKAISEIVSGIQNKINNWPTTEVFINYGSVSGMSILKNVGPKFEIELETSGVIKQSLESNFEEAGYNQTLHKIYLNLNMDINMLTPIGCFGDIVDTKVLLTEAVIVGKIPDMLRN